MKKLDGAVKLFIVQRLAMFETPSDVVQAVKVEFGIDVTPQHVRTYNPEQCEVVPKWKVEFDTARKAFREKIENIPIANRAFRLKSIGDVEQRARKRGNDSLVLAACRQAAEEQGEVYTNRRFMGLSGEVRGGCFVVPGPISAEDWVASVAPAQAALGKNAKAAAVAATKAGAKK